METTRTKIEKLTEQDTYSLLLFALYKLKDVPGYSTLSELAYALDKDSLLKLLKLFGGMTITIPRIRDMKLASYCLLLYKYVELDGIEFNRAVKMLNLSSDYSLKEIKELYFTLCDVLQNYSFNRGL